ncbi:MAG: hypothetical protein ABI637_04275 [Gemmatimonadota bacterium]
MTAGRRYLLLLAVLAVAGVVLAELLPLEMRRGLWMALAFGMALQAPLGWWLVESVGRPRFLAVWSLGMLGRLALVAVLGLVVLPGAEIPPERVLIPLVVLLTLFVLLEAVVLMGQHSRTGIR